MQLSIEQNINSNSEGIISHTQTYCTHDGPGIRSTAFFIGCNLRCLWCANPEAMLPGDKLFYHQNLCQKCGKCVAHFPDFVHFQDGHIEVIRDKIMIEELPSLCNYHAYQKKGKTIKSKDLVKELVKDSYFFQASNGGVTLSGGEPFLQPEFLLETIQLLKQENIHVAIETAGNYNIDDYRDIVDLTDLFLYDIKAYSASIHKACTGVDNHLIMNNLERLVQLEKEVHVRLVLVPNYNDQKEDVLKRIDYLSKFKSHIQKIDLLKYHNYGHGKYQAMGIPYPLDNLSYNEEEFEKFIEYVKEYATAKGFLVTVGG